MTFPLSLTHFYIFFISKGYKYPMIIIRQCSQDVNSFFEHREFISRGEKSLHIPRK